MSNQMEKMEYVIVSEEMVWLFVNEEYNSRGFRELLGKDARDFLANLPATVQELSSGIENVPQ
jgi:adenosyl cobinamide kinase/adenosyl cobinamide phosphate guanylyltransferase